MTGGPSFSGVEARVRHHRHPAHGGMCRAPDWIAFSPRRWNFWCRPSCVPLRLPPTVLLLHLLGSSAQSHRARVREAHRRSLSLLLSRPAIVQRAVTAFPSSPHPDAAAFATLDPGLIELVVSRRVRGGGPPTTFRRVVLPRAAGIADRRDPRFAPTLPRYRVVRGGGGGGGGRGGGGGGGGGEGGDVGGNIAGVTRTVSISIYDQQRSTIGRYRTSLFLLRFSFPVAGATYSRARRVGSPGRPTDLAIASPLSARLHARASLRSRNASITVPVRPRGVV